MLENRLLRFHLMTQCDCILFDFGVRLRSNGRLRDTMAIVLCFFHFFEQLKSVESIENEEEKTSKNKIQEMRYLLQ